MIQTKYLSFPANEDYTSDWIVNDLNYRQSFNLSSIMINWDGLEGTLDGTLKIEITNNPDTTGFVTVLDTITLNSASNLTDNEFLSIGYRIKAFRYVYTKNGVTGENAVIKTNADTGV